jgi:hypothetical protein
VDVKKNETDDKEAPLDPSNLGKKLRISTGLEVK